MTRFVPAAVAAIAFLAAARAAAGAALFAEEGFVLSNGAPPGGRWLIFSDMDNDNRWPPESD